MTRRWLRRFQIVVLLAAVLVPAYFLWFRDSSLVEVKRLRVTGVSGPDAVRIRSALAAAVEGMTTLHIDRDRLGRAASQFPIVKAIRTDTDFPNGLTIHVVERQPVAVIAAGGQHVAVAGDGTLLRGVRADDLPQLRLETAPSGARLTGGGLDAARILGATPKPLRPLVAEAFLGDDGVRVELRNGPELRFGDASSAARKWAAAARLLADDRVGSAGYVDVSAPDRAAVGGSVQLEPPSTEPSAPAPPVSTAP